MAKKFSALLEKMPKARLEEICAEADRMEQEMALSELRKARHVTQTQLAERLNIKQPGVAEMEKRTDMYVSTLRALIDGMGANWIL